MKEIIITVDENDADYISAKNNISDEDILKLESIINKMPKNNNGEIEFTDEDIWDTEIDSEYYYSYITESEKDFLSNYLPLSEHGFHTITAIEIVNDSKKIL